MRRLAFWNKPQSEPTRTSLRGKSLFWPLDGALVQTSIKRGVYLGAICLMAGLWVKRDAVISYGYTLSADAGLVLSDLHISGRNYTSHEDIKSAIGAPYGTALMALSLSEIKHNLEQLGWVKSANVSRIYPDAIAIDIDERRPLALLQSTGGHRLIDELGHVIFGANASAFSHLPVLSGEGAAEQAKPIIEALRTEPDLFADVWAIQRISNRRWDVHLRTGLSVRLPEKDAALAWSKLAILDRDTKIMKRDLATIDLRVSGQLIVEPNLPLSKKGQKT